MQYNEKLDAALAALKGDMVETLQLGKFSRAYCITKSRFSIRYAFKPSSHASQSV